MKRLFLLPALLGLLLVPQSGSATDDTYINSGVIAFSNVPPQIDATNFINTGSFSIFTPSLLPFDVSNTLNFTNTGTMVGSVGFRFDTAPNIGPRRLAANFRNRLTGNISAVDGYQGLFTFIDGRPLIEDHDIPSFLVISATNIINEGLLSAGAAGTLQMVGSNVNLTRSGVQIRPIQPLGSLNGFLTNYFIPDSAIYDIYWGQDNQIMNSANIVRNFGAVVQSPPSQVQGVGVAGFAIVRLINPVGDFYEQTLGFTNLSITNATGEVTSTNVPTTNVVQAAFVEVPSNDVSVGIRFFDSSDIRNPFKTVSVGLQVISTNFVTANPELASLYVVDTLASETNRLLLTNVVSGITYRPANYLLSRLEPFEYFFGFPGNAPFRPDILYQTDFETAVVTNEYAAYAGAVENIARQFTVVTNADITLLPGRIGVVANSLDMTRARFRGEGLVKIETQHLVGSSNAAVDGENLSYTLGSTNGNLNAVSLAQETVARLKGTNYLWSGLWTNQWNMLIENYMQDPDDTNSYILAPITNVVQVRIHALLVGAQLLTRLPVKVYEFVTHSTNVVVNDRMTIVQKLLIDGESFTLNGSITLSNTTFVSPAGNTVVISLSDWVSTNAPNLLHFTNNGTFTIPSEAHFGDDRPLPYTSFVNAGTINAGGQDIASSYFENSGILNAAAGGMRIVTPSGKVENGRINSITDVQYFGNVLKLNRATIQTGSRLDLAVTNSLFDAGGSSSNSITCRDGFRLLIKPQTGDLLGTAVQTAAPDFAAIDHVWAGLDRGPIQAGYSNNVALGQLLLIPGRFEDVFPPLFVFSGTGVSNALYVDSLNLTNLADFENEMQIDPNLVIYYAAAAANTNIDLGLQTPEEFFDGRFGNRLRWVRDFAGPNSSVDVLVNGTQTISVNRALRNSRIIDSDGDGIPNYFDFTPFDGVLLAQPAASLSGFRVSWMATPGVVYHVEYKAGANVPWQPLTTVTFNSPTNGICSVLDTNRAVGSPMRLYRVWYNPVH
jgi:hypothetical protein